MLLKETMPITVSKIPYILCDAVYQCTRKIFLLQNNFKQLLCKLLYVCFLFQISDGSNVELSGW